MTSHLIAPLVALVAVSALSACSPPQEQQADAPAEPDATAGLAIEIAQAEAVSNLPIASVPGTVTLPPEARVAVTAPFPGAAVRVFVIEGQLVGRGAPLALLRASEPVQIRGELVRAQSEARLAEARAQRLSQLAQEGIIAEARAAEAQAMLEQANASVAELGRLASQGGVGPNGMMTLRAPISGRVAHVGVETGGGIDGMDAPFVIEADGAYQVELQLPERLARQVRPGMPVEISMGDNAIPVGGQIIAVSPSIDPTTRAVLARANIGAAPGIIAGRNVTVTIQGKGEGIAVPEIALTRISGDDYVFVRGNDSWEPRKVSVAARSGGLAVITTGLTAGETVAASSIAELKAMNAE